MEINMKTIKEKAKHIHIIRHKTGIYLSLLLTVTILSHLAFTDTVLAGVGDDRAVIETVLSRIFHPDEDMIQMYDNWQAMQESITASKWNGTQAFPNKEMEAFYDYFTEEGYDSFCRQRLSVACFEAYKSGYELSLEKVDIRQSRFLSGHYTFNAYLNVTGDKDEKDGLRVTGKVFIEKNTHKISYINIDKNSMAAALLAK